MSTGNKTNTHSVYDGIRDKLSEYIENLMGLPSYPVWIHESSLHKIIMPYRDVHETFGRYHMLSCVIKTIRDGKGGNKKRGTLFVVDQKFAKHQFTNSVSNTSIAIQTHGTPEFFDAGSINPQTKGIARWFRCGGGVACSLDIQKSIVAEATGKVDDGILDVDTKKRRSANYNNFLRGASDDGGYSTIDLPSLALRFHGHLKDVISSVDDKQINENGVPSRRAFKHEELMHFSTILRMMIASSNVKGSHGKLVVSKGEFDIQITSRLASTAVGNINPSAIPSDRTPPPNPSNPTQARKPPPPRTNSTLSTGRNSIPDCLLLKNLGVSSNILLASMSNHSI